MNTNIAYLALMGLFLSILIYLGVQIKKARGGGAVCKWGTISKKIGFPIFFGQRQKSNTQAS